VATPPAQAEKFVSHAAKIASVTSGVLMSSCWTVMLAFEDSIDFPADGAIVYDSSLSWIDRNSSKSGRRNSKDCWLIQASAEWWAEHLEESREFLTSRLSSEFHRVVGCTEALPIDHAAHRWRYAIRTAPLDAGCLFDEEFNVGLCGDWCFGKRIEAAFLMRRCRWDRVMKVTSFAD